MTSKRDQLEAERVKLSGEIIDLCEDIHAIYGDWAIDIESLPVEMARIARELAKATQRIAIVDRLLSVESKRGK